MARTVDKPTVGARGAIMGRPRKDPPEDAAKQIYELAAKGCCSLTRLSAALKVSRELLKEWFDKNDQLRDSFKFGCEANAQELVEILMNDARDRARPNLNAFFLLKVLHGFREGEQPDNGARVYVTVNLPGAMSRDEYLKMVTQDGRTIEADPVPATRRIDTRRV